MKQQSFAMLRRANAPLSWLQRLIGIACAVLTLAASGIAFAQEDLPGRVGRVADLAGELFLAPQDKPDQWAAIGINYPVASGDNLWAGNDGRAEVDFGAGQFRLAGNSNVHLSRLDDRQFALFVAQGLVQVRVRVLDPGETARIDTPNAQIVLTRPGSYRVEVSDDREHTQVVVREGEANVLTSVAVQQVLPGQTANVDGTDPQYAAVRNGIGADGFDAWVANRERHYGRGAYASYVSPQMVGAADLDQYGTWTQTPDYGAVWYPTAVAADWAPYRDGYWTDVGPWGPTWVDAAPWGYAPFHYGRWAYIGGRWGWFPGRYVARPLWAPALVGWAGGAGWGVSVGVGAPVYGWVPLAWGEPYRPWWGRCSQGCWDRYNRPYAVNVAVVRPNSPLPVRYANWNAPGGISAMSGPALIARKPVYSNLVAVPSNMASTAPVLASAPLIRAEPGRIPVRRPGEGAPPPASTFYPTIARPSSVPGGMNATTGNTPANQVRTDTRPRATTPPTAPGALVRQAPTASPPASTVGNVVPAMPVTRTQQPIPQQAPQAATPQNAVPVTRNDPRYTGRAQPQTAAPPTPNAPVANAQPSSVQQAPNNVTRQSQRQTFTPQPAPQVVTPAPTIRQMPQQGAPVAVQQQPAHVAPAPQPAPHAAQEGGNVRREQRGGEQNPDKDKGAPQK
jgi:hypothetical protein